MNTKNIVIAIAALLVIGVGGWYAVAKGPIGGLAAVGGTSAVATVNGTAISQADLERKERQVAQSQKLDLASTTAEQKASIQKTSLDSLIGHELLKQAAVSAGITASTTEIDAQVAAIKTQLGGDEAFKAALTKEGITEEMFRSQVADDFAVQTYLSRTINPASVEVTDAEAKAAYEQLSAGQQGVPPYDQVKDQVKQMVQQQKSQQLVQAEVDRLRAAADVKVLI
jgi:hypothetical protein